jgi:hypothetical protein
MMIPVRVPHGRGAAAHSSHDITRCAQEGKPLGGGLCSNVVALPFARFAIAVFFCVSRSTRPADARQSTFSIVIVSKVSEDCAGLKLRLLSQCEILRCASACKMRRACKVPPY